MTFRSRKPFKVLATRAGRAVMLSYGSWRAFGRSQLGIPTPGRVTRTGRFVTTIEPSWCFGGGPTETDTGPYDCRTLSRPGWHTRLDWRGKRMEVHVVNRTALTDPFDDEDSFDSCPLIIAHGADEASITSISQAYPVRDLFDSSQGLVEVLGRKRFTYRDQFRHGTTTVSWKVRLRRVR